MTPFHPANSVCVITGGASGIGRALAQALLQRGARAVIVADVNLEAARETATALGRSGGNVVAAALDVGNAQAVRDLVSRVEAEWGAIDLWCSNAGINVGKGLGEIAEWEQTLAVNVMGHVHAARAVLPGMKKRGAGCFVVTASAAGLLSDFRTATYTASKHAAVAIAEWLAITARSDGIAVHCICPEGVRTGMTQASSEQAAKGMVFLEAEDVARHTLDRIEAGEFLILPHPRVAEYELRRATDRQRWIESMQKAFLRMLADQAAVH